MKNGKKPTRKQLAIIIKNVGTPGDWLVSKSTLDELLLVNRFTGKTKTIWL